VNESLVLQLLGWALTLGGSWGIMRERMRNLAKDTTELAERTKVLEKLCGSCLARLEREEKK